MYLNLYPKHVADRYLVLHIILSRKCKVNIHEFLQGYRGTTTLTLQKGWLKISSTFLPSEFLISMNQRKFKGLLAQTLAEEEGVEGCQLDFTIATATT